MIFSRGRSGSVVNSFRYPLIAFRNRRLLIIKLCIPRMVCAPTLPAECLRFLLFSQSLRPLQRVGKSWIFRTVRAHVHDVGSSPGQRCVFAALCERLGAVSGGAFSCLNLWFSKIAGNRYPGTESEGALAGVFTMVRAGVCEYGTILICPNILLRRWTECR